MAVVDSSFKDAQQASVKKGTDVIRISGVDDTGALLSSTATDAVGNSGTSSYELQYKRTSTFSDEADIEQLINEAGKPIGFREGDRIVAIEGEMYGQVNDNLMKVLMSIRDTNHSFWRVIDYEFEEGGEYVKREFWKCYFEPRLNSVRGAGETSVTPFRIVALEAAGAVSDAVGKLFYKFTDDTASIPALASETWTALGA